MWERVWEQGGVESVAWYPEPTLRTEQEARDWIDAKAASHTAHGWAVAQGIDSFDASKTRADLTVKERRIFIRQVA